MSEVEHRAVAELRFAADGRTVTGVALPYGVVSPTHRERFEAGAFGAPATVPLNLLHDETVAVGDARLDDGPRALRFEADIPAGGAVSRLVRDGVVRGASIEFHARGEHREGGIRVVTAADLVGIALVGRPSYPTPIEVRAAGCARLGALAWL